MKHALLITSCIVTIPAYALFFNRRASHPLNERRETPHIARLIGSTQLNTSAQWGFLTLLAACIRMHNKAYNSDHLELTNSFTPAGLLAHPLQSIDDGIIGHPGNHMQLRPYGILGRCWSLIPYIDNTLISVDRAQRQAEAWVAWIKHNLRELDKQSSPQKVINSITNWIRY